MAETAEARPSPAAAAVPLFDNGKWVWEKNYPEGLDWRAPLAKKPLWHILDQAVQKWPANILCDFMGKTMTYAELALQVERAARGLQDIGVTKGVKVGLFLPNTPYSIIFFYAVLKAGGTVVNYNPVYADREIKAQIEDSGTDILVTLNVKILYDKAAVMLRETRLQKVIVCGMADILPFPKNILFPLLKRKAIATPPRDEHHVFYADLVNNTGAPNVTLVDAENDIAVLQYTGGTTGVPKGAMLTHGSIYANVQQITCWVSKVIEPGKETMMGILPFFHVFAMTVVMHCSILSGMKIVMHAKFAAKDLLESLKKHRPTFFPVVPSILTVLATHPGVEKYDFSCIKSCISGGAPLPNDVRRMFEEKTGCDKIREGYGLTETSPGVSFNPPVGVNKIGSVGMPVPGTVIEIIDPDTKKIMAVGERGEVCIAGPQVMRGYYKKMEETANVMKEGRLHTGDVGYFDKDGYLYLVDRIKDLIIVRGYNVYPRMVEEAIYLHPAVEECIVAGVPDTERGETVWAWVKLIAGKTLTEAELHKFLEDKVSPIEMPRRVIFKDKPLPKTAVGKLSKKDLLEQEGIKRK